MRGEPRGVRHAGFRLRMILDDPDDGGFSAKSTGETGRQGQGETGGRRRIAMARGHDFVQRASLDAAFQQPVERRIGAQADAMSPPCRSKVWRGALTIAFDPRDGITQKADFFRSVANPFGATLQRHRLTP